MLRLLLALQIGTVPPAPAAPLLPPVPETPQAVRARVDSASRFFLTLWRLAWQESHDLTKERAAVDNQLDSAARVLALHCHWVGTSLRIRRFQIRSARSAQASCPMWYPTDAPRVPDERRYLDAAISPLRRAFIADRRLSLRMVLDSAAMRLPGDPHIAGQRVRFALDDHDIPGAAIAAAGCAGDAATCSLLHALVLYQVGNIVASDSAFGAAAAAMPSEARCKWNDIGVLLEPDARQAYDESKCAERAATEARVWWLADPLYGDPGNERRAEHFARKTLITLIAPLGFDGRQHFVPTRGGDAVIETLIRYGWPSHVHWDGIWVDQAHGGWVRAQVADSAPPYIVREYSAGRLHTVPSSHAISSPFEATAEDWTLSGELKDGFDDWWPREHFARDRGPIVSLPPGQSVMLRRRAATRWLWAGDVQGSALSRTSGDSVSAQVFESREPEVVHVLTSARARVGSALRADAPIAGGRAILAVEIAGDSAHAAARSRFGVTIPEPLATLDRGKALSQPMLFDPLRNSATPVDADVAARRMYPTTTFAGVRRLGVYWESYGVAAGDTADIELHVTRTDSPGFAARLVDIFRPGSSRPEKLDVRWRETSGNSGAILRMEGSVPVQMRSVVVDLTRLPKGSYMLQVTMRARGAALLTGERAFVLR